MMGYDMRLLNHSGTLLKNYKKSLQLISWINVITLVQEMFLSQRASENFLFAFLSVKIQYKGEAVVSTKISMLHKA